MTKVRAIINELDGGAVHTYYPLKVTLQDQGIKKPNQIISVFTMANIVKEGDTISYIQDVTDVDALRAIYNFQLSALDEGGYDQDPTTDPGSSRFVNTSNQKYKGFYALLFNAVDQEVEITTVDAIDLSGQFDIFVSFTAQTSQSFTGNEPILWSFFDGTNGLEIGITGTDNVDDSWRGFARYNNSSGTNSITGANELIIRRTNGSQDPILIRISRGQDNVLRMFVNGEQDASATVTGSLQPTGVDMIFGSNRTSLSNADYQGTIHQIRVYCGEDLSASQATLIREAKPIPFSMRFRGKIWNVKDNTVSKTVYAQANSYELLTAKMGDSSGGSGTEFDLSSTSFTSILQSAVNTITLSNSFIVKALDTFEFDDTDLPNSSQSGKLISVGSFLDFSDYLFKLSFTTFFITPRNVLIVESRDGHSTDFVFEQKDNELSPNVASPYNIAVNNLNDTNLINEVILTSSNVTNVRSVVSPNDIRRTLRRNIEQLDNGSDLENYATRLRDVLRGEPIANPVAKDKHIIKITSLINSVRPNLEVAIKNERKNIDTDEVISQVTYSYPSEHTIINTGEIDLDYYNDVEKVVATTDDLLDVNVVN